MTDPVPASPSPAVTRAFAILHAIAGAAQPLGPSALARHLGIAKSSISNLCRALEAEGALQRVDRGYVLGRTLAELGGAFLSEVDEVRNFYRTVNRAADQHPNTIQLATLTNGLEVVYLARRDGSQPVRLASEIGRRLPASCTAVGKALLAQLPVDELDALLADADPLPRPTRRSITTMEELRFELQRIRDRGYAIDDGEMADSVVCVGVALPMTVYRRQPMAVSLTLMQAVATQELIESSVNLLRDLAAELAGAPLPDR